MGTFAEYSGTMNIPEDKRKQFTGQMMKILNYGGMMEFERTSMFGKELGLLKPANILSDGEVCLHYNYFEDTAWEPACYESDPPGFWSGKIGGSEFCDVVLAAYTLFELYDDNPGFVLLDGDILNIDMPVAWINHLLGTRFSSFKRSTLWGMAEAYAFSHVDNREKPFAYSDLMDIVPRRLRYYTGGVDFSDLCYITRGTDSLTVCCLAH